MFWTRYKYYFLGFLAAIALVFGFAVLEQNKESKFEVVFLNVGQGDSIFIQDKVGHQILIDGGAGKVVLNELGNKMPFWDYTLDLVILTHPDKDHLEGLIAVLNKYEVEKVLLAGIKDESAEYQIFQEMIKKQKIPILVPKRGEKIELTDGNLGFLFPGNDFEGKKVKDTNATSSVIRLVTETQQYLFTGDAGTNVENSLIKENIYLKSDILKIAHHGSKNSTSDNFLRAVAPTEAIISVGKNSYGHPTDVVLKRLQDFGAKILRTDEVGDIIYNN